MRAPIKRAYVYKQLKKDIAENIFPAGTFLPNEINLAKKYCVGRKTMRSVLAMLQDEHLIKRERPRGTIVCDTQKRLKRNVIGVIGVNSLTTESKKQLMLMETIAARHDYHIHTVECNKRMIIAHPEYFVQFPADGLIFNGSSTTLKLCRMLKEHNFPMVGTCPVEGFPELDWMENPHSAAINEGLEYLHSIGHRRVGYIDYQKQPEFQWLHDLTKSLFEKNFKDDFNDELFYTRENILTFYSLYGEEYQQENCRRALRYFLQLNSPPTAILIGSSV